MSKLIFNYGAMNSGKSTMILQKAYNYNERGMKVILLKPEIDTKGEAFITSRLGIDRKVDMLIKPTDDVYKLISNNFNVMEYNAILIDEVQFLNRSQIDQLMKIKNNFNIDILCYGLRLTYLGEGFEGSIRLLEIADELNELYTLCDCGEKATFNLRLINGKAVFSGDTVSIDDKNDKQEYVSVCPKCFYKAKDQA